MALFLIFALAIAFLAILFALQNNSWVTINLFAWQYQESLAIVLLITLAIGVVVGLLVAAPTILRRGWRISRERRRLEGLEENIQANHKVVAKQTQKTETVRRSYQALLKTLGLIDPITSLLHRHSLNQVVDFTLQQMQANLEDPRYCSLCIFMMTAERTKTQDSLNNSAQDELLWRGIARTLELQTLDDSWLYSNGAGEFACTTLGLKIEAAAKYGESLHASLTEQSIQLPDGAVAAVSVSFGGAIADREKPVDAQTLIAQAEQALDQAKQRGRNRFWLVKAS